MSNIGCGFVGAFYIFIRFFYAIILNDKLVGAVTHVFVNDPTRGYGIFIENMLAEEEKIK